MTVREMRAKARENLSGRWGEILKPAFLNWLIPVILGILLSLILVGVGVGSLADISELSDVLDAGALGIVVLLVFGILFFIVSSWLAYGMAACILTLSRGETVTFGTLFSKIKERAGKVIKVGLRVAVETFFLALLMLVGVFIGGLVGGIAGSLIGLLISISVYIYVLIKMVEIALAAVFANFVIHDNPDRSSKEILNVSKKIAGKKFAKYVAVVLSYMLWFLLPVTIESLMEILGYVIWEPSVSIFGVISNTPSWYTFVVTAIVGIIGIIAAIKILAATYVIYDDLEPERLFEPGYEVQSEEKKYVLIALGLMILYIALVMAIAAGIGVFTYAILV